MRTALRKMGNSTGVILPRAILGQAGLATGTAMDVTVEGERLILTPVHQDRRADWKEAASAIAQSSDAEAAAWEAFGNEDDAELTW
jgi:antitoxin MazE